MPIVIGVGALAVILILVGLFMLFGNGFGGGGQETAAEPASDEAAPAGEETAGEELAVVSTADLSLLPNGFTPKGEIVILRDGAAVSVPGGVQATDDLYLWNGEDWVFLPSLVSGDGQQLQILEAPAGQEVVVVERPEPASVILGSEIAPEQEMPADFLPVLTEISVGGLRLGSNGELSGEATSMPTGGYAQLLHVTNGGVIVDQTALSQLLSDPALRTAHIQDLVGRASSGGYAGINLDYQGVVAGQAADFTAFVQELADTARTAGLQLIVTLAAPTPLENGAGWDSGGQNWAEIGQIADGIYAQMPLDPTSFADGGQADAMLRWATRQVDRAKLTAMVSANAIDKLGGALRELPLSEALAKIGTPEFAGGEELSAVDPSTPIQVALAGEASPLEWDGNSLTYKYSYEEEGQTRTVWLNSDAALANRLRLAERYRLRGATVRGLAAGVDPARYLQALDSYTADASAPEPVGAAITWTVENAEGGVVASASGEALDFTWEGADAPGVYVINAGFAQGDMTMDIGSLAITVGDPAAAAADEEADTAAEGEEETETAASESESETAETTATEVVASGSANARVNIGANIRTGPGVIFGILFGADPGTRVEVIGRSSDSQWLNVIFADGEEGWIFAQLLDLDETVNVAGLPVPEVTASPVAAAPPASSGGGSAPAAPAAPAPVAPANLGGSFELGGHLLGGGYGQAAYARMSWVKRQHKWSPGNTGQEVAGMITEAHNAGFKILLSIPGQLYPTSLPDFNAYTEFLRNVASLPDPPDAIEIWNEMNIEVEWPRGQIDPAMYVNNMLAPAYNAIKSTNPNIMVISGAPAPTGFFQGGCTPSGCDDDAYIRGMAAAGAANYMDCIGVHYNEGILPPSQRSGDPRGNSGHYTRYFWGMLDTYYNAFGGSRPICFTELGYVSGEGWGSLPGGFSWGGNTTVAQQAQWLAEAVSLSANSGKVRLFIVWNVDSTTWGQDPQAGYAIIRKDGSCPACETLRQVMGGG